MLIPALDCRIGPLLTRRSVPTTKWWSPRLPKHGQRHIQNLLSLQAAYATAAAAQDDSEGTAPKIFVVSYSSRRLLDPSSRLVPNPTSVTKPQGSRLAEFFPFFFAFLQQRQTVAVDQSVTVSWLVDCVEAQLREHENLVLSGWEIGNPCNSGVKEDEPETTNELDTKDKPVLTDDPWVLYCCLQNTRGSAAFTSEPEHHHVFTKLLEFNLKVVSSPQTSLDRLVRILRDMHDSGIKVTEEDWALVIKTFKRWGRFGSVWDFESSETAASIQFAINAGFYRALLFTFTDPDMDKDAALWTIDKLKNSFDDLSTVSHEAIIRGMYRMNMFEEVIQYLVTYIREGHDPSPYMICRTLGALARFRGSKIHSIQGCPQTVELGMKLFNEALDKPLTDNMRSKIWTEMFALCRRHGDVNLGQHLYDEMSKVEEEPSVGTCLVLMSWCIARGEGAQADRFFKEALERGDPKSSGPYHHRIKAYVKKRWFTTAELWFDIMEEREIKPLRRTYLLTIAAMSKRHPDRALELYERMVADGWKPDEELKEKIVRRLEEITKSAVLAYHQESVEYLDGTAELAGDSTNPQSDSAAEQDDEFVVDVRQWQLA
ncbi:hypothetical protein HK102_002529 [Quaeritorhiza haematococci]|nr:hypothetical protein HK102_002529 [Quaeritorhiza haematococci]